MALDCPVNCISEQSETADW